jgi:hypothetical protein
LFPAFDESNSKYSIDLIELILNYDRAYEEQYAYNWLTFSTDIIKLDADKPDLRIQTHSNYLMIYYPQDSSIEFHTFCGYDEHVTSYDQTKCTPNNEGEISISPEEILFYCDFSEEYDLSDEV